MNNILVGKTILSVEIAKDKMAIKFNTNAGEIIAKTDGDCCSHSWIEEVELPALGFPALCLSYENMNFVKPSKEFDGDHIQFYGCKIITDKGEIIIDYRNSSNGYYGGNLWWPMEDDSYNHFYGGVYGQNISKEKWMKLE